MNDTIGVIGLGTMGIGIAGHLLDEGCTVKGYDINPERLRILAEKGGIPTSSPSQTAKDCSALVLMVFNGEQVMNVLFGENGAAESLKPGSCVIICASVGAPACEQAAEKLEHMGIHLVDSPVRGTALSCETGTLYLMVGASDEAFTAAKGVLDTIGSCVVRAGHKAGMGQKAKTCMLAFFSLTFQSTYEVLALGTAMGLDPATVYSILDDTGASSNIFRATARNVASRQFTGTGNPLSILDKDMKIACQTANTYGLPVPSIAATSANFSKAMEEHGTDDVWSAILPLEKAAGIEVKFDIP